MRLLLVALALAAACATPAPVVDVKVQPSIYTPEMSSTVGIGFEPDYPGDVRFRYRTDFGFFLSWAPPDNQVIPHGAEYETGREKIYWSFDMHGMQRDKRTATVTVEVLPKNGGAPLNTAVIFLDWDGESFRLR